MTALFGHLYTLVLCGLALYAVHIILLIVFYLWHRRDANPPLPHMPEGNLPTVTVQIPLRNEQYVVSRILQAVAGLDWPRDRLTIQILDDSDDDTTALAAMETTRLGAQGVHIQLIHRPHPEGYKAGALAVGLAQAPGDFVAIFDADFCPSPDFLRLTVPHLIANPDLGMVQTRWGHLNADDSLVTRAEAIALDAHFTVEHIARNRAGLLMNFNGTAGVWRRHAIDSAGGWQMDTVAEDLDLSYRAQLAGWKVLYLPDVVAPAELPPLVAAFKQQQYRWAKGATQVLRKLAVPIVRSPNLSFYQKIMALLHLSGYFTQPLLLALILLTLPVAVYTPHLPVQVAALGTLTMLPSLLYILGQMELYRDWYRRILIYPVLMLLGIGITWNTTLAIMDGFHNWGGEFRRTPKFRLQGRRDTWRDSSYRVPMDKGLPGEILISLYVITALVVAVAWRQTSIIPLNLICLIGVGLVLWGSLVQAQSRNNKRRNNKQGR